MKYFSLLVLCLLLLCLGGPRFFEGKKTRITLQDLIYPELTLEDSKATWISDDKLVYKNTLNELWSIDVHLKDSINKTLLVDNRTMNRFTDDWIVSPSARYIAFTIDKHGVARYQTMRKITFLNSQTKTSFNLTLCTENSLWIVNFQWRPTGDEDEFAYVCNHDIYFHSMSRSISTRVTDTGSDDVYNGIPDWMNEEEILSSENAIWWSPYSSSFAYLSFNTSLVTKSFIPSYDQDLHSHGPAFKEMAYPRVNESISTISLHVWQAKSNGSSLLRPAKVIQDLKEFYIYNIKWLSDDRLLIVWADRVQTTIFHTQCSVPSGNCTLYYKHTYNKTWMNSDNPLIHHASTVSYFGTLPKLESDGFLYNHVARFDYGHGVNEPVFLTSGLWEVISVVGLDQENENLYYISAEAEFRDEKLYRVSTNGSSEQVPFCVSCQVNTTSACESISVSFSHNGKFYIFTCNGPSVPTKHLLSSSSLNTSIILEENSAYKDYIQMPTTKYMKIPLGNGYDAMVKLILPMDFNEKEQNSKLPLIVKVYAGPDSQMVTKDFSVEYDTHLVTDKGYAVAYIDGRGSGNRGSRYTEPLYKHFGTVEIEDQILATKILLNTTKWLDPDNVMIWGWSYGGFVTSQVIVQDEFKTFKCVAAVAPVIDFRLYDAAYTERYMGLNTESDNAEGYMVSNVLNNVEAFKKGEFLLIHGLADDNVHFQNTALLVDKLQSENIPFQFMMYPNQKHSLAERWLHVHELLDSFFDGCLGSEKR